MARLEEKLDALRTLAEAGPSPALRKRLTTVLKGRSGHLIALAARLAQTHRLTELTDALVGAFHTLCTDGARRDPSCSGKAACLTTLDHFDHLAIDIFEKAATTIQLEKAWGPPVDTAAPVRSRAALALSRFPEPDATTLLGLLLADPAESVRRAAIEAVSGRPGAGGLLAFRWQTPDDDALVAQLECGVALIRSAGELGIQLVSARLSSPVEAEREVAALALAESRAPAALNHLGASLETAILPGERALLIRAIAAHRSPGAQALLLSLIDDGSDADARAALTARLDLPIDARDRAELIDRAAARGVRLPLA